MNSDCLFCKLKDSANAVYQDSDLYVLVDRHPLSNRHILIIPKKHGAVLHECDDSTLEKIIVLAKKIVKKFKLEKYNLLQNNINGQIIPHFHLHLIGCNETGGLKLHSDSKELKLSDEEYDKIVDEVRKMLNE